MDGFYYFLTFNPHYAMDLSHSIKKIPFGVNSIGYCSHEAPSKLVVFIHGFNGSAVGTWDDFPKLIMNHKKFEEADVIFFGYDSLKLQAGNMKIRFYELLEKAINPKAIGFPDRGLQEAFQYPRVVIVGHSLGAVVSRLTLLYAYDKKAPWLDRCEMVYFAPAHWGSRIPENFKECFSGLTTLFRGFAITKYPIIADLTEGSTILNDLLARTTELSKAETPNYIKAKAIIWAEREIVVVNNKYGCDNPEDDIPGASHTSVCKPDTKFLHPFEKLIPHI